MTDTRNKVALYLSQDQKADLLVQLIRESSPREFVQVSRRVLRETKRRSYTMSSVPGWKSLQQEFERFGAEMREALRKTTGGN